MTIRKELPRISVITAVRNGGQCIGRAIDSVLAQDYPAFEHIVVDGLSNDGTVDILKRYPHLRWLSEPDAGQVDAMQKGFRLSEGDVIVYLNADDFFFPGAFHTVSSEFVKGAVVVMGNVLVKSSRLGTEFLNTPRTDLFGMLRHWEANAFSHNPVGYFYRREIQIDCPFNVDNDLTMDLEFLLDVAAKYPITKVETTLGCFDDRRESKTGVSQQRLDYWDPRTFRYLEKHLSTLPLDERESYERDRRKGYAQVQAHLNRIHRSSIRFRNRAGISLISVIIPTFNCEAWLIRCIDSVLAQDHARFEVIVVDDCSSDGTQDLLQDTYSRDKRVRVIQHDENKKQGAARNTGMSAAQGDYLFFVDSDDWVDQGVLQHLSSIADEYAADIVQCGVRKVHQDGCIQPYHSHAFACTSGLDALYQLSDWRIATVVWNKLYRSEFLNKHDVRFPEPYLHEDVEFTLNSAYHCDRFISISEIYYNYFMRSNAITSEDPTQHHLLSYIHVVKAFADFFSRTRLTDSAEGARLARRLFRQHVYCDIFPRIVKFRRIHGSVNWYNGLRQAFASEFPVADSTAEVLLDSILA